MNKNNKFYFVIRDDDLSYFSQPADIEKWYSDIFMQNIPVGFSTIPFVKKTSDVYIVKDSDGDDNIEYGISRNKELISYINTNPFIEIMQHGYNHETQNGVFEYKNIKLDLDNLTERGKNELELSFKRTINIFIPPHDQISNKGIRAIEKAGLNIIRSKGSKNILMRYEYFLALLKMIIHIFRYILMSEDDKPAYPTIIDLKYHKEAFSIRLETRKESILKRLNFLSKNGGYLVITNHLYTLDIEKKEKLLEIISTAKKLGAVFIYPHELFNK